MLSPPLFAADKKETDTSTTTEEEKDPAELLKITSKNAATTKALAGGERAYANAKKLLARGKPAAALKAVRRAKMYLLADRIWLLRGDALLALGNKKKAKEAYEKALENAQLKPVAIAAARGLVNVLGQLKENEDQLLYIEALLAERWVPRRAHLVWQQAVVLNRLKRRDDAARIAWRLLLDYPTASVAKHAEKLLKRLKRQRVKIPSTSGRLELARIRNLVRSRAYQRAVKSMEKLEKKKPKLKRLIEMLRAEMFKRRRNRVEEQQVLQRLEKEGLTDDDGPEILWRLGKIHMNRDNDKGAIARFDELAKKFPKSKQAKEGQYLASWIPYNGGDFAQATKRMLSFAEDHKKSRRRTEALWFAGWSAYLDKNYGLSRRSFEQLLEEHPSSTLVPHARYWLGRIHQKAKENELAKQEYREVLKTSPLSYDGFWAMVRLEELGETVVLTPPPPTPPPATIKKVIGVLGPMRPLTIDRAVALHRVDLIKEALQELSAANRFLKSVRDTKGRTMVADMLHKLGAHHQAFRVAMSIAADGGDIITGKPYAWRAWRHAYPKAFFEHVEKASKEHEIDPLLVLSIMRTESHFRPYVRSHAGARGLMQLMPGTAKRIGRKNKDARPHAARYKNPASNIWLGSWYLKSLIERYGGQIAGAIGGYNAGPGAMDQWIAKQHGMELDEFIERVPYRETRRYLRRVFETYSIYSLLNNAELPDLKIKVKKMEPPDGAVAF